MGVIVVTGIPGVGKTTVMKKAAEGMKIEFVTFGTVMSEIALEQKLVAHRDEMRKLSLLQQRDLQIKAAKKISLMGTVIVDTHCTIKTPKGYMPGLPEWVLKELKPTSIVVVEADPAEIYGRRTRDTTRSRDVDSTEQIAEHQFVNRAAAMAYAALTGATVKIVYNHDDALDDAVKQAEPVIR